MIRTKLYIPFILILGLMAISYSGAGQISQGGIPPSFEQGMINGTFTYMFPSPDLPALKAEDQLNAEQGYPQPERMGYAVPVGLSINDAGTWDQLPDGSKIWRMEIRSPGALALGVYFDRFVLPEHGRLFVYNKSRTMVIGAFTAENNHPSGLFATQFVEGDWIVLEYHQPANQATMPVLSISEVAYAYRLIRFEEQDQRLDPSWPCMINVVCEEGDGWEDQIQGIARISIKIGWSYYWCSGSLINNTSNDRQPYFLTAAHCGEGASVADMNQWIFYFNYQSSTCTGTYGPQNNTNTGCTFKANDPTASDAGSDFLLVKLNYTPPSGYNVYYNGWNRTNVPGQHGVGLHHPAGDIKKVSTYLNPLISSTWWNGLPTHWRLSWSETPNGLSIMQGGSSGSPIFDEDQLIMGDLTGGYASNSCSNPSPAWYGKIWYSWDQNGNTPATRLKDWLDPTNTGIEKMPGLSSQILPPIVDFTADTTQILQGDTIHFFDLTTGNPTMEREWYFEGGLPEISETENPTVVYLGYGTFDVSLTITNADGTDSLVRVDYITVTQVIAPEADFVADTTTITEGETVNFTDLTLNSPDQWQWVFDGGTPYTSTEQNPQGILYEVPGTFDVALTAYNNGGSDTENKTAYITVNAGLPPVADFVADQTEIMAGDSVNFTDLSTNNPTQWVWTFTGGTPDGSSDQNPQGIVYNTPGTYDVSLRAKNSFGFNIMTKTGYIFVGGISVGDLNRYSGVMAYPNPTKGAIALTLDQQGDAPVCVTVFDGQGRNVYSKEGIPPRGTFRMDLSQWGSGLFIIQVRSGDRILHRKISVQL